jgi:DNA-binding NtrC family response regulator
MEEKANSRKADRGGPQVCSCYGEELMNPHVILLLNADPDVEKALNEVASQRGHELVTAHTAAESFRILRDDAKDVKLVIIDIDPEMHGVALLTAVAGFRENVPIVAVTSLEESYMKPLAMRRGAVECLGKPVAANRFAKAIQRHCGAREASGSTG